MNMHQQNFSNQNNSDINNIGAVSEGVDYIAEKNIELYQFNKGPLILVNSLTNQIEYAFGNLNNGIGISKKDMINLRMKWHGVNKNPGFNSHVITEGMSKILNKIITDVENKNLINTSEDINNTKNPAFPNSTYIYKNQYGKEFKVVTMGGKAINITCDNNYITGHQRGAITRAINENRLDKFEEFIPVQSTQLSVIDNTNKILTGEYLGKEANLSNIDHGEYYKNIRQKVADSSNLILSAHYIDNIYSQVENFTTNNFPSIKHIEAAQSYIALMYKRIGVEKNTISDLLQTAPTIHYMFEKIDESICNEGYNISFVQVLLQLSEIIKNIFLSTISQQKRAYH